MPNKLLTVTIAICALNEESNIGFLLKSILSQKEEGFILEEILIISDGSTDKTVEIIKTFKSSKIKIIDHKGRLGKSTRLNEIYSSVKSDIVVQPDADVILGDNYVLKNIVAPFYEGEIIGMTGGNPLPLPAVNFLEKSVNYTLEAYIPFRKTLSGGNNILSATGRLLALRKEVFSKIKVPKDTIANDGFVYFCTIMQGYKYRFAQNATVYFRSPQTLKDHISQSTRFAATHVWMKQFFPAEVVEREYFIPPDELREKMIEIFKKHPVACSFIFLVNKYCALRAFILKKRITALWEIVYTTKKLK